MTTKIRLPRFYTLALVLVVSARTWTATQGERPKEELFRQFLENPPPLDKLVFKLTDYTPKRTNTSYFFAKWQTDALVLREGKSLSEALSLGPHPKCIAFGYYNTDRFWYSDLTGRQIYLSDILTNVQSKLTQSGSPLALAEGGILSYVFTFGVGGMRVGDLAWHGNAFEGRGTYSGFHISGDLLITNGLPVELAYRINTGSDIYQWKAILRYAGDLSLAYIPNTIELYWTQREHPLHMKDITIMEIVPRMTNDQANAFAYPLYLNTNQSKLLRFAKDGAKPNNRDHEAVPTPDSSSFTYIFVVACGIVTVILFSLLLFKKTGEQHKNNITERMQ